MYTIAVFVGCLSFVPWLIVLLKNSSRAVAAVDWVKVPMPIPRLIYSWVENAGYVLIVSRLDDISLPLVFSVILTLITFTFIVYCSYFLCRRYPNRIWLYIFISGGVAAGFMMVPDLTTGGMRSSINRYLIPAWISIQLIITSYLASVIKSSIPSTSSSNGRTSQVSKFIFVFIMSAVLASDFIVLQANDAWIKQINKDIPEIAQIINSSPQPLVISGNFRINFGQILSLSHSLDSSVKLLLVQEPVIPEIPTQFKTIWLYDPSYTLKHYIQKAGFQNQLIHQRGALWQLLNSP
jgi:uncharacterized membrane protein